MALTRKALAVLTRTELLEVGRSLGLEVNSAMRLDELIDVVAGSKKVRLDRVLGALSRDTLKSICFAVGISADGREKDVLRERILARARGEDGDGETESTTPGGKAARVPIQKEGASGAVEAVPFGQGADTVAPPATAGPQQDLPWQAFPMLDRSAPSSGSLVPGAGGVATVTPPGATNGAGATPTAPRGESMEPAIPDGAWAIFRLFAGGVVPSPIALDGRRVVVELRGQEDPDLGGAYTLKRWRVSKSTPEGGVAERTLVPDNPDFKPIRLRPEDGDVRAIPEFVEVVG